MQFGVVMAEVAAAEAELPLDNAGVRLARARVAKGMTLAQLTAVTRIPERHLAAIEAGNYAVLPARMYAVAFARSMAKAVGADVAEIVDAVRRELDEQQVETPRRAAQAFEPGDPARVPGSRLAWLAALAALLVVLAGLLFWRSYYAPAGELPSLIATDEVPAAAPTATAPAAVTAPAADPVVFTARENGVWVKFSDGNGDQLMQRQMAQGETWTVPADLADVKIWTARPDALDITVGGMPVPRLAEAQGTVKDVSVTAAALLARPAPGASPSASPVASPAASLAASALATRPAPRASASAPAPARLAAPTEGVPAAASPTPDPVADR